ncbi:MAG: hypothetical protein JSV65_12365 [Armatimonadota bacterium]|nr:MAG: hypothetical protein JSV65_12365 [Armatimonadota bacterium]
MLRLLAGVVIAAVCAVPCRAIAETGLGVCPWPQEVSLREGGGFEPAEGMAVMVGDGVSVRELTAAYILADALRERCAVDVPVLCPLPDAQLPPRTVVVGGPGADWLPLMTTPPDHAEGYALVASEDAIVVRGADIPGTCWGLQTARQLVEQGAVPAVTIRDWPEMPVRATYCGGARLDDRIRGIVDECARLKINMIVFESGDFFHLDGATVDRVQELFRYCRDRCVEPVPELQSFGHGGNVLAIDARTAEGEFVKGERHVLSGDEPAALDHANVIVTSATGIVIRPARGKAYREGTDYVVIEGVTARPYARDAAPWRVARTADSAIPDGADVFTDYDYIPPDSGTYCPEEPLVWDIMRDAIHRTVAYLRPRYLHIGHDEPRVLGRDRRCVAKGKSNARLVADDLVRIRRYAAEADARVRLMMWSDPLNPYHNAPHHRLQAAARLAPRDIIQNVWFYGTTPRDRERKSVRFFTDLGYDATGSPWARRGNLRNSYDWAMVCNRLRDEGNGKCLGVFYTSWSNEWDGLPVVAEYAWSPDRPDLEPLFDLSVRMPDVKTDGALGDADEVVRALAERIHGGALPQEVSQGVEEMAAQVRLKLEAQFPPAVLSKDSPHPLVRAAIVRVEAAAMYGDLAKAMDRAIHAYRVVQRGLEYEADDAVMESLSLLRRHGAIETSRFIEQAAEAYLAGQPLSSLAGIGAEPVLADGYPERWMIVGPFLNADPKGGELAYPPEGSVDLGAAYAARNGPATWQSVDVVHPLGHVDLARIHEPS